MAEKGLVRDEYAAIHPHLVVPALVHDGRLHLESMDIVQYLDETWPEHPLMPAGPEADEVRRGDALSMADIIWAIKVLRIAECGYPFRRKFPALDAWYGCISRRRGFQDGVMSRHRTMSRVFRLKAAVENLVGVGLGRAVAQ